MSDARSHVPVLENTVVDVLSPKEGETVLDATLGLGGHAKRFGESIGSSGTLIGLDADTANLELAQKNLSELSCKMTMHHLNFRQIDSLDLPPLDVLFADVGLSSLHVDDPERGFSFRFDAPLDLRFDRTSGRTAAELIAQSDIDDLKKIFWAYGEMKQAGKLATIIKERTILTTFDLKNAVEIAYGWKAKQFLPQVFQALRIAVNDEIAALEHLLGVGPSLLAQNGRMGILSFHSLEDRAVKHAFRALSTPLKDPITGKVSVEASFELLTPKAVVPTPEEIARNPRARSVKFRAIKRLR